MAPHPADTTSSRLLAALSYLPGGSIVTLVSADPGDVALRFHARQGLVLFFLEIVAAAAFVILDGTIGRVPLLGGALVGLLKMVAGLTLLVTAAAGVLRVASGDSYRIPILAEYADRLKI